MSHLADELREEIVQVVSSRGGHLASNLGVAELTIALHYVFDFSRDRLTWDVGHQSYAHKILTGRAGRFSSLRQKDGLSGFPSPAESDYDLFATGHAGAAISTALGLAWADQHTRANTNVVAVVGDASIINGMSFEAINNVSLLHRQFLIVLNDNSMAIDRTGGAMASLLDRIRMTDMYSDIKHSTEQMLQLDMYSDIKHSTEQMLQRLPLGDEIAEALRHIKDGLRTTIHGGHLFEALGFAYFGPVDGHNVGELISVLRRLAKVDRPALLHVHTQKGRGCDYAVEDPCRFHSPAAYSIEEGRAVFPPRPGETWTQVFGRSLLTLARRDKRIVAITAAMPDGTGLNDFRKEFPDRCIDVGIGESNAVAMAAGLAKAGLRPVVAIYSTFMQRAFDQLFQEASLQKLPILLCMDRGGLVGSDGPTHHGFMDIAFLRPLPGMVIAAPADAAEMQAALEMGLSLEGPCAIRYPRDEVPTELDGQCPPFQPGRARVVRRGADATLLSYGAMVGHALEAASQLADSGLDVSVVNARFAKPLDTALITRLIRSAKPMLVLEDHAIVGGFGSAVMELAADRGLDSQNVRLLGIPDRFIAHATRSEQLAEIGLDAAGIATTIKDMLRHTPSKVTGRYQPGAAP